jgi:hypothetical protein
MAQGETIPKVIHQTFGWQPPAGDGGDPLAGLPDPIRQNIESLKRDNPGWEHRLYNDADIERYIGLAYGPRILAYYHRIDPRFGAARADLFRYLVVYREGGVYLDIKSTFTQPIDTVIRPGDTYWLATWRNKAGEVHENYGVWRDLATLPDGEFQQWHIVAVPGHPFLRAVIDAVLTNIDRYDPVFHGAGRTGVIRVTGPIAYTKAIVPLLSQYPHRLVRGEDQLGLQYSFLGQLNHFKLFKTHYQSLTGSVVKMRGPQRVTAGIYIGVLRTMNRLGLLARSVTLLRPVAH